MKDHTRERVVRLLVPTILLGSAVAIAIFLSASGSSIPSSTADVVARISVGSQPEAMAVSSHQQTAFVVNQGSADLSVVDLRTGSVRQIHLGPNLTDVAISPDQRELLVSSDGNGSAPRSVYALSAATGALLGTADVGGSSDAVAFGPDGQDAYVAVDQDIAIVRVRDLKVLATIAIKGLGPGFMTVSPNGKNLYVDSDPGWVGNKAIPVLLEVIDLSSRKVTARLAQGDDPPCGLAMTPNGQFLYESYCEVVVPKNSLLPRPIPPMRVIRASTDTVVGTIPVLDGSRGTVFSPNGRVAYTAVTSSDAVAEIDTATRSVIGEIVIPGASGFAVLNVLDMSPSGRLLYALTEPPFDPSPPLVELKLPAGH